MSAPRICSPAAWPPPGLDEVTADDVGTEMACVLPGAFLEAMPGRLEMLLPRHELVRRGRRDARGKKVLPYFASVNCALGAAGVWSSWNIDLVYRWTNGHDFLF
jgi:hypothetical protein